MAHPNGNGLPSRTMCVATPQNHVWDDFMGHPRKCQDPRLSTTTGDCSHSVINYLLVVLMLWQISTSYSLCIHNKNIPECLKLEGDRQKTKLWIHTCHNYLSSCSSCCDEPSCLCFWSFEQDPLWLMCSQVLWSGESLCCRSVHFETTQVKNHSYQTKK